METPAGDFEVITSAPTTLGEIILAQRRLPSSVVITELMLDHQFLMSSHSTASERALATLAVETHGGENLRVLVGGLGLGYTAHAALASPRVAEVEVVELLAPVIEWLDADLLPLSAELRGHPRLFLRCDDIYAELAGPPRQPYDVIIVDVDHSPDEPLSCTEDTFHSAEGLRLARAHLAPGGVLGVWSYTESPLFLAAMRSVFPTVRAEPISFYNPAIQEDETNWVFLGLG